MSTLPQGWDSDYDGSRWFFIFRPTGQIQYHFPKPGDEFPDFIDSFAPAPTLLPEEKLESQQQVKRRSTTGSSSRARAAAQRQREASALPALDDEGGFEYSFESFGYLGPQSYNDVSPLNDEEEDLGPGRADKLKDGVGKDSPATTSTPGERPRVSPMTSAGTTPQVGNTEPASGTPILGDPVMGESSTVHTIAEEPIMSEPIMSGPVLGVNTSGIPLQGMTHGSSQSPTVPMLDGTEISPPAAPTFSPVGYMPELYSESTAQCNEETNPPPVELPDNAIWVEPIQTGGFINEHPVELPTQHSPVEKRQQEAPTVAVSVDYRASSAHQTQYPHGISASFASVSPPAENVSQKPVAAQPQSEHYQPWNPNQQMQEVSTKRGSIILGNMSIAESQRNELGALDNRRSPGVPTPSPKIDPSSVPAILAPPKVPPKQTIGEYGLGEALMTNAQTTGTVHPLMPGAGARHASISNPPTQIPETASLSNFPSILKPGPRQGLDRTGAVVPSNQPFQPQQKQYMAYQPAHPMPGVPPASYAQLIQPRQYQAMPPGDSHPSPLRPGSSQQFASEPRPGVPRTNTVPNQLPSQAPPPMLTPSPVSAPDGKQEMNQEVTLQGVSFGQQRMSTGNIHSNQLQKPIEQMAHAFEPSTNVPVPNMGSQGYVISNPDIRPVKGSSRGQQSVNHHEASADSMAKADKPWSYPADSGQILGNLRGSVPHAAASSPPVDVSKPQRYNSPAQSFVMGDVMIDNDAHITRTPGPPLASKERSQNGRSKEENPTGSFNVGESASMQGPQIHEGTSREPQSPEIVELKGPAASEPISNTALSVDQSDTAPRITKSGKSSESVAVQRQGRTPSITISSHESVTKDSEYVPATLVSMPVLAEKTPQISQTSAQPAQQDSVSEGHKESVQTTSHFPAGTMSPQDPQLSSQPTREVQLAPEVSKDSIASVQVSSAQSRQDQQLPDVRRINSPPVEPTPNPQETQIRHPSQDSQQSYRPQAVPWVQTSQMPTAPRNVNSPVGPWSVANLPGMAVLHPSAPAMPPLEQPVQLPHLQTPSPSRPNQLDQHTAPRNDHRTGVPQSNVQSPPALNNNPNAETHQVFSPHADAVITQAPTSVPPSTTTAQKNQGQLPAATSGPSVMITQQSQQPSHVGPIRQQQGPLLQQSMSVQDQRVQSPGVMSGQQYPQAMGNPTQPQYQPSQLGQPPLMKGPHQQQVPDQRPQIPPKVSLPTSSANAMSPNAGMPLTRPLPVQTVPVQQTGSGAGFPITGPITGSPLVGHQVSASLRGSQPAQPTLGVASGPQLGGGPSPQQPSIISQVGPRTQQIRPNQAQAVPSYGGPAPPLIPDQRPQMQGNQRPQALSHHSGPGPVPGQVSSSAQPHSQMPQGFHPATQPGPNQFSSHPLQVASSGTLVSPPQMQNMQSNAGPGTSSGQVPYNPRTYPPMPAPLITQPFNGQQPGWGQGGTPTQLGSQSPSSQRRASQQSIPPASPSSRRASGYQIQPGTQSPVVTQQSHFPQSQAPSSSNPGAAGKDKNWFSKMWKTPGNKKGSISGGSISSANVGMNGAPGIPPVPNMYDQTRPGPSKLQKPQLPPGPQYQQQPQGYHMPYSVPVQIPTQIQGQPRPYVQPVSQGMTQQPVPGQPPMFQGFPSHTQSSVPSQRGNAPPPAFGPGTGGQPLQAPQGVSAPHWPQQNQNNTAPAVHQGLPAGQPGQQGLPGQSIQPPSGQHHQNQMLPGPQNHPSHPSQPPTAQQQWLYNQGAMGGAPRGLFIPGTAMQQNQVTQIQGHPHPHAQPQPPQFAQQASMLPQQPPQRRESEGVVTAASAVAGAIGIIAAANASAPPADDSCTVAPLFSGTGQPASIPGPADSSISGDSRYAAVERGDTASVDVETVSIDANGNAWTTTSVDYEGNDWGGTW